MNDEIEQAKALASREDAVRGLVAFGRVYDPLLFAPEIIQFTAKQYIFLRHFRFGLPLEEAAFKANMTPESAERFLEKPSTKRWLEDRALKDHIKNEWAEPGKWWKQGDEWLNGETKPDKNKVEIWKEFGKRVCPISESHGSGPTKIEINIDAGALEESRKRRQSIEAQVVNDHG